MTASIDVALQRLSLEELGQLCAALEGDAVKTVKLGHREGSAWLNIAAAIVNQCVRGSRSGLAPERALWSAQCSSLKEKIDERRLALAPREGKNATPPAGSDVLNASMTDGEFIQTIFEIVLGRCAHPRDIHQWATRLSGGEMNRKDVLSAIFSLAVTEADTLSKGADTSSCSIMGTQRTLHAADWHSRAAELTTQERGEKLEPSEPYSRFSIRAQPRVLVTAIASLYRGGEFIERFMENMTSQSIFDDYCELVIVDADSPDGEASVIERFLSGRSNIQYVRTNCRVGIYDAWNLALKMARGAYITSTNVDDLRREDSFELQAAVLDNLDFVDVAYQDFHYTFDPRLSAAEVARFDYKSELPLVTPYTMMSCNSPHNAPMWRKSLHDELGWFDTRYQSAGDYEFWLRCVAAGKTFYKLDDPHVIYYQNPQGLSTRPETRGVDEVRDVLKRYSSALISPNVTSDLRDFIVNTVGLPETVEENNGDMDQRYAIVQAELRKLGFGSKF